ncbi:hypothetical protein SERLA73DRAFT_107163 [Serpula lacrymans var. lacrymans S7.3]|uniref:DNA topoisomerase (ATP-hydrolyzing) n=1 Tax=Serpula lacrymans var. lacrymans (strain S7.3) TaxID=936435 RepID=F8PVF8_SERL3|nr:hypothetical protein SERLA73DRAFT_107163 [Serpula lacrymans var. lacrymans S7.3]
MHEALLYDIPVTKRDMYYKDVSLFKSQATVDRLVDDVAATFELNRSDLHVRASTKGLICGSGLLIHLTGGETIHINESEGALIPVGEDIDRFEIEGDMAWVLIVEKDAVFQTLCRLQFASHPSLPGPGIIITGKGYPDVATRQLVKTFSDNLPSHIPILALVDGDAYGIDILSVYKYGSWSLRHENGKLAAERVEWLGIWTSELADLGIDIDSMIPITKHDEKKAILMLQRPPETMPAPWRKELMRMLHTRRKAEIEILSAHYSNNVKHTSTNIPGYPFLLHYLSGKIIDIIAPSV